MTSHLNMYIWRDSTSYNC